MKHPDFAQRFQQAVAQAMQAGKIPGDSQEQLGRLLGVSGVTIWSYKTGEKLPRMARAISIAQALGVSAEWLLTGQGPQTVESVSHQQPNFVADGDNRSAIGVAARTYQDRRYEQASPEHRQAVDSMADKLLNLSPEHAQIVRQAMEMLLKAHESGKD